MDALREKALEDRDSWKKKVKPVSSNFFKNIFKKSNGGISSEFVKNFKFLHNMEPKGQNEEEKEEIKNPFIPMSKNYSNNRKQDNTWNLNKKGDE